MLSRCLLGSTAKTWHEERQDMAWQVLLPWLWFSYFGLLNCMMGPRRFHRLRSSEPLPLQVPPPHMGPVYMMPAPAPRFMGCCQAMNCLNRLTCSFGKVATEECNSVQLVSHPPLHCDLVSMVGECFRILSMGWTKVSPQRVPRAFGHFAQEGWAMRRLDLRRSATASAWFCSWEHTHSAPML